MIERRYACRIAAGYGAAIWIAAGIAAGRAEAWDSGLYWVAGLPLLLLGAGVGGWFYCDKNPSRFGLWMGAGHSAGVFATGVATGSGLGLLPLSIGVLVIISLILMIPAGITGWVCRRFFAKA